MLNQNGTRLNSTEVILYSNNKKSSMRNISWSFVGSLPANRPERVKNVEIFKSWTPNTVKSGLTPDQMKDIYNNSLFVLVGRGNVNLDCFRVYEAMISGAIPIIIGKESEYSFVFEYQGHRPPLVFAESAENAISICKTMNATEIDQRREALTNWYRRQIHCIKHEVLLLLQNHTRLLIGRPGAPIFH